MKTFLSVFLLWLCVVSVSAHADTLLLAHGYLGSAQQWNHAGIVMQLDNLGWHNAGQLRVNNDKVRSNKITPTTMRRMYTLSLSSEKSIQDQSDQLHHYVEYVREQHHGEQIILVGHSAGGVVARLYMVEQANDDLIALITIASPHLGTDRASFIGYFPQELLAWLEPIPGLNMLYRSQGLFYDLMPNRSDNLIGWLNYQEHPPAQYHSIIREPSEKISELDLSFQDLIVPSWSQDMNEVYALRGRCKTYVVKGLHGLSKQDGKILQQILVDLYTI